MGRGALRSRPCPRLWAAAALLGVAAACASPEAVPEAAAEPAGEASPAFAADPLAGAPPAAAAAAGDAPVAFADDPLLGAPMLAPSQPAAGGAMQELPEGPPEPEFDAELVDRSSELGMAVLRARFLTEELGRASRIEMPPGPFHFGEVVPLKFELRNPVGETVALLPPEGGLVLELSWEVQRWLPIGGHEAVRRYRWYRLADTIELGPDESTWTRTELPLRMDGDPGALWQVRLDARLRCAGARMGERELPVHRLDYRGSVIFAFPEGWESLQESPLDNLRRVLANPSPEVDRHVLVSTALLQGQDRYRGLDMLLDSLNRPVSSARALTATAALQWLTQLPLGDYPADWIRWHEERKLAARSRP